MSELPRTEQPLRQVILNADDYGMSQGVVDGIIEAARLGAITSTTVLVSAPAFEYGISKIAELGNISVGVHLDLTSGVPCAGRVEAPTVVDLATGRFVNVRDPAVLSRVAPEDLKAEFRKQVEKARAAGIDPSHLDNHANWIYFSPRHFRVVAELGRELGIPVRVPISSMARDAVLDRRMESLARYAARAVPDIAKLAAQYRQLLEETQVAHTDFFWIEFTSVQRTSDYLRSLIDTLPSGTSEICVHPGHDNERKRLELGILKDLKAEGVLQDHGDLRFISYRELHSTRS